MPKAKTQTAPKTKTVEIQSKEAAKADTPAKETGETEEIAAKFNWSFPSTKKPEAEDAAAQKSRSRLAVRARAVEKEAFGETAATVARYEEDEEEEDEVLKALDKYFVFEEEKTKQERP